MIKIPKKNKNKINGPFLLVEHTYWDSKAFRDLSPHARNLYCEFKRRFNGENAYNLQMPEGELKEKKIMSISAFRNARDQLIEKGFIDIRQRGGLWKQATIFMLSERWRKYGKPDFEKKTIDDYPPTGFKTIFKKGHNFFGNQHNPSKKKYQT
jgi:hypothetical protein